MEQTLKAEPGLKETVDWIKVGNASDFPENAGMAVLIGALQIAVFYFASENKWLACQNMCPQGRAMILSRGLIGDVAGQLKVTCPMHKHSFDLRTGQCQDDESLQVKIYAVRLSSQAVEIAIEKEEQPIS